MRQPVRPGKLPVPLVVPGHGHDRPGAVAAEDVGRGPDRHLLAGERVHGASAEVDAHREVRLHVGPGQRSPPLLHGGAAVGSDERVELGVIRPDDQEGGTEESVGPGGEDGDLVAGAALEPEVDEGALAAPDPVALRQLGPLAPVQPVQGVEHLLRVAGGPDEPLLEEAGLHGGAAALAVPAQHLLIGQHGEAGRAPVDRALAMLGEPGFEELEEDPLGPAIVGGAGGVDLVRPIDTEAELLELLLPEVLDVAGGQGGRVLTDLERVILGVDPEGVEAQRLEDVVPLLAPVAAVDVRSGEGVGVADVQLLRRGVGEHHEAVEGSGTLHVGAVGLPLRPDPLPLGVEGGQVEAVDPGGGGGRGRRALHWRHRVPRRRVHARRAGHPAPAPAQVPGGSAPGPASVSS